MKMVRSAVALCAAMLAVGAAAAVISVPEAAQARTSVSVGIGVGPIFPAYGYYHPYRYYAPPPPVVQYYAPPPVVYVPPSPVVQYAPPSPVGVDPAGPVYYSRSGQQCREYQSRAMVGGRSQPVYGTACLQSDGTWRIVN
ncbi:Putative transmembrane protein [Azospirillum endophyticum]